MGAKNTERTRYGAGKYSAFLLMISRWLRLYSSTRQYRYVTLGGTELRDLQTLYYVDPTLVLHAKSYEEESTRYNWAAQVADALRVKGVDVEVIHGSFFDYERTGTEPHIFFLDLEGIFAWSNYHMRVGDMLTDGTIQEGDTVFVTSHLGHNPGWAKVFSAFDGQFRLLKVSRDIEKQKMYRKSHPSFTMFKALEYSGLSNALAMKCFASISYQGSCPMGLYGFNFAVGQTDFVDLVTDVSATLIEVKGTFALAL
jgi:hypothetical protein